MNHTWGRTGFDWLVPTTNVQRVMAYHASPGVGIPNANDSIAAEADRGISEIEAFLADAALATV